MACTDIQMRSALIGSTGFLGGNLAGQFSFDECYHSRNIGEIRGREIGLLVCGGVTALKWWANQNPDEDRARIDSLLGHLARVEAARVVILSTVDVYPRISGVDETFDAHGLPNHAYGTNRLYFEDAMRARFGELTVVRISGVFGPGLKKNVLYDLLHGNCLDQIHPESEFQYYNAARLWRDLQRIEAKGIRLANLVSPPLRTGELIERFFPAARVGVGPLPPTRYDIRTVHSGELGGPAGYWSSAEDTLCEMGEFVRTVRGVRA